MTTLQKPMVLLALLGLVEGAVAQELHVSGGYNATNVRESGDDPNAWTGRTGYQFGADLQLGDVWFARGGVHLQVRNMDYSTTTLDTAGASDLVNTSFTYTERSLRVPLLIGRNLLRSSDDPPVNVYVLAGPTALLHLSTSLDNDDLDVEAAPAQWLIGFGGGLTFSFLFAEATYGIGMSDIFKGETFGTNPRVNQFCLNAGIRLKLAH